MPSGRKEALTEKEIGKIKILLESGVTVQAVAVRFEVSKMTILRTRRMLRERGAIDAPAKPAKKPKRAAPYKGDGWREFAIHAG